VAEVLAGDHVHLTADAIYSKAQGLLPEISLATVYNTLNELVDMGEVLEISTGDGPKRYDPNTTVAHHHLYCVGCGALRDVSPEGTDQLALATSQQHGFELLDIDIVFRGRCPFARVGSAAPAPLGRGDSLIVLGSQRTLAGTRSPARGQCRMGE
jgi:Fur family transcriptional regulator, stress-responsive regulator